MTVRIIETSKFDLKNPILIEGFPGLGLVGTISASYLADKLGMEPLGYITSERFPPIAAIHNYNPLFPARLYKSKKHNIVVLFSELIMPIQTIHALTDEIIGWSLKHKVKQIISLGGIGIKGEQDEVFGVASSPELNKKLQKAGVKLIKEGATTGVNGLLLAKCASMNFPAISLLAESKPEYLDPLAAAMVLDALNKLTGLKVDTSKLTQESKLLESKLKELMANAKTSHDQYKKAEGTGPMYG
ncbi:MAG: proteasome assembly chaperone family protein [Candidatus Micrarchaeota archaeon]